MEIIHQLPCRYQKLCKDNFKFILLHKLITNKTYRDFYKNKSKDSYFLLDNGAYELGESMNSYLLLIWSKIIKAEELVVPDFFGNK